jgi:hypothetical protein
MIINKVIGNNNKKPVESLQAVPAEQVSDRITNYPKAVIKTVKI